MEFWIIFILLVCLGGSCSLAGTWWTKEWWSKRKEKKYK